VASAQVRQVSPAGMSCEQPTWAPNGRHLAFACLQRDRLQITIASADGGHVTTLDTGPGNNEQPDWSR
jgi:Tol biopolymer transport system component